jgi:peptidoglycan/LPS O-acetylase OafA/YrhL
MGLLRILLAICVLFQHSGSTLGNLNWVRGTTAVEMFFVISGFYMQMILRERYTPERLGPRYVGIFYLARYSRLLPAYFACLVLTILIAFAYQFVRGTPNQMLQTWSAISDLPPVLQNLCLSVWVVLTNITMFFQDLGLVLSVRDGVAHFTAHRLTTDLYVNSSLAIPQAWSLGVELTFYAVAPFLLRLRNSMLLWLLFVALFVKLYGIYLDHLDDLPYRATPFVMVDFMAGALAYRFQQQLVPAKLLRSSFASWFAYLLVIILVSAFPATDGPAALMMVGLMTLALPTIFAATRHYRLDNSIGELSYPFYIFHLLVYTSLHFVLKAVTGHEENPQALLWASLLGTLAVSLLVTRLESRFLEPWRRGLGSVA